MSRGRFGLLLALLVVVVGVGAFLVTSVLLDDGPTTPSGATTTTAGTPAPPSSSTTATVATGEIGDTPAYVIVVTSAIDEGSAQASRDELADQGFDNVGVLDSDDYASLNPGYYVTYVGPYATSAEATAGRDELVNAGYSIKQVYVRCVGTKEECS
jgi:hypothetical protein